MTSEKKPIQPRQRRRLRNSLILIGLCLIAYQFLLRDNKTSQNSQHVFSKSHHAGPHPQEILNNLSLTTSQCTTLFPNLTFPIDDVLAQGPFTAHPKTPPLLISLHNRHQLAILKSQPKRDLSTEMLASRTAALHQLHRAILTQPPSDSPLPNTLISLNFQDQPFGTSWAYSRQADPQSRPGATDGDANARTWLMPHFSFWAWKLPFIGSMGRAAEAIASLEAATSSFANKIPKAVWRGTTWFNSVHNPRLRANLIGATKDKPWADVEALKWDTVSTDTKNGERTASNSLMIEDFCKYKYVLYTEGVTYSGRFQFLQMCESVLITPAISWMQHATHLVRPVFSNALKGMEGGWTASEMVKRAWPESWDVEEANAVFVKPDWSDLEDVIHWLEEHPREAEGIARRQRETFVDGGYFSPAAEMCYWRALIRGWSEVARWDAEELQALGEGQTYEAFVLTNGD